MFYSSLFVGKKEKERKKSCYYM